MMTSPERGLAWFAVGAVGLLSAVSAIRWRTRPVQATGDERTRRLPGDDLIAEPLGSLTHAITIRAEPREVWQWLAQMGAGRGGWYPYDRLDNGGQPSATRIVADLQQLTRGMVFPALPGVTDGFTVATFAPVKFLVLEWTAPEGVRLVTWAFVLDELQHGSTRLVVRVRAGTGYRFHGLPWSVARLIVPVLHFVMERKQLLGIAERAEAHAVRSAA